jgi:hypothetical protein
LPGITDLLGPIADTLCPVYNGSSEAGGCSVRQAVVEPQLSHFVHLPILIENPGRAASQLPEGGISHHRASHEPIDSNFHISAGSDEQPQGGPSRRRWPG